MALIAWAGVLLSGVGLARMFRRSLLAMPFVLVALPTVFARPGTPVFALDVASVHLTATGQGLDFFLSVLLKSWVSVTAAALLTATTPFTRILEAAAWLRVPRVLIAIVSFMYRYVFVLVDQAQRLLRARAARSASLGPRSGGSIPWRARVAGGMAGSLFIRTYDRSERIYMAMLARGYDGRARDTVTAPLTSLAMAQGAAALAVLVALAVAAQLVW